MKIVTSVAVIFILMGLTSREGIAQIDSTIAQLCQIHQTVEGIPALGVAVIQKGELFHLQTLGKKDLNGQKEVSIDDSWQIASVSKTILNLLIFKLVEDGRIKLDQDISDYLPFKVYNPHVPNSVITVKRLLNHRSGILDNHRWYGPVWLGILKSGKKIKFLKKKLKLVMILSLCLLNGETKRIN